MTEAYKENDPNMIISTTLDAPDIQFYDIRKAPVDVYGFYDYKNEPHFHRMPLDIAQGISPGVFKSQQESTGARVRFTTDSSYVAIKVEYNSIGRSSHLSLVSSAGFDLYEETLNGSHYVRNFLPPYDMQDGYEQIIRFGDRKLRSFTINFPVHSIVRNFYIGLQNDASLSNGKPYRNSAPVVFYGSSIVHGTAATRPGLIYENMISRKLDLNFLNLGFSGQAKGEQAMADYLASLDMLVFICDYDHNAPTVQHLADTHFRLYETIRARHPSLPYIMISKPDVATNMPEDCRARRDVIIDSFRRARSLGDSNVYYIDGETFFRGYNEDDCSMDGCHPNDLGFSRMAECIGCVISNILRSLPVR